MLKSLLSAFTHITYKGVLSRGFCCVQVNSVLKSLLSTFTHITYKGALSRGFCCVQVNSVLKSLLSAFSPYTKCSCKIMRKISNELYQAGELTITFVW